MGRPMASPSPLSRKWALKSSSQASRPASIFRESRWLRSQRQETRERRKGTRFLPHTTHPDGAKSVPTARAAVPAALGAGLVGRGCALLPALAPPAAPSSWDVVGASWRSAGRPQVWPRCLFARLVSRRPPPLPPGAAAPQAVPALLLLPPWRLHSCTVSNRNAHLPTGLGSVWPFRGTRSLAPSLAVPCAVPPAWARGCHVSVLTGAVDSPRGPVSITRRSRRRLASICARPAPSAAPRGRPPVPRHGARLSSAGRPSQRSHPGTSQALDRAAPDARARPPPLRVGPDMACPAKRCPAARAQPRRCLPGTRTHRPAPPRRPAPGAARPRPHFAPSCALLTRACSVGGTPAPGSGDPQRGVRELGSRWRPRLGRSL